MKTITTSWDDGSPADLRLAELLAKYGIQGTFYIPKENAEHAVMTENEMIAISRHFEIGGHTLSHKSLGSSSDREMIYEVEGSYNWLNTILQKPPIAFCLPYGHYSDRSLEIIYKSGFRYIRTTELLSLSGGPGLSHTTIQIFRHSRFTYLKHLMKHGRFKNMALWMRSGCTDDHFRLLDYYLEYIEQQGGCLHLWGHSWEIEEFSLWERLELILRHISNRQGFKYVQNGELTA